MTDAAPRPPSTAALARMSPAASTSTAACAIGVLAIGDTGADVLRGDTAYGTVQARNTGSRACTITGYPGLTLTAGGGLVQTRLTRAPGRRATTVTLQPGGVASFGFSHSRYQTQHAHCDRITGARVFDPDGSGYRATRTSFDECEGITPTGLKSVPVTVGPFVAGDQATLS